MQVTAAGRAPAAQRHDDPRRDQVLGVGEPVVIPGQSAIANALYNACGVRVRDLPLSRDKIINGLQAL